MTTGLSIILVICILLACTFEFVNGFHDTANAVATVIYTNSLKPTYAVIYSGALNFLGVLTGGVAVAMGIVNLLPMEVLVDGNVNHGIAMILAILISAIVWNVGTWYFAIPASSSHTLIGSILGIGLAFYFLPDNVGGSAVNWSKAQDTGLALLVSPLAGFMMAIIIMFVFKRIIKDKDIYQEADQNKKPPLPIRMLLWLTCGLVSFFHGQNDGQKGVGLIMLILIMIMPSYYSLDENVNLQSIKTNVVTIEQLVIKADSSILSKKELEIRSKLINTCHTFSNTVNNKISATDIELSNKIDVRKQIVIISKSAEKLLKSENLALSDKELKMLKTQIKASKKIIEYAPSWVIILISLCLGLGTMIGWKRIVKTIGEKIGKQHMSYAQGASAELVAATGIGLASGFGLPVSTTHMLNSAVMGTMVAKKGLKNLQKKTVMNMLLAWVLTLPVTIVLSGALFLLFRAIL